MKKPDHTLIFTDCRATVPYTGGRRESSQLCGYTAPGVRVDELGAASPGTESRGCAGTGGCFPRYRIEGVCWMAYKTPA